MNTEPQPLLHAQNLTCIKQDRVLFENLSFTVNEGDVVVVGGPNGAGKTSLLRILAGLAQPTEGQIDFKDHPVDDDPEAFKRSLLYLGHLTGMKSELTAEENLKFNLALHGLDPSCAAKQLKQVGLSAFDDAMAGTLSAGQKRKIALAQLWQHDSEIWILDEPFTAIDARGVTQLEQQILQHAERGGCVIMTTHQALTIPAERITQLNLEYRF